MLAALPPPMTRSTTSKRSSSRIRFAPLPDPRRAVLITENGDEIPLQAWLELPTPLSSVTSSPIKKFEVLDDEYDDDDDKDTSLASIPAAVSLAALSCFQNGNNAGGSTTSSLRFTTEPSTTAGTMSRSNSEHSLMTMGTTPSGSIYSSPSTSTSDTVSTPTPLSPSSSTKSSSRTSFFRRFRKSSTASTNSSNEDADSGLQRWTSASSGGSLGFPISRTQSAQSDKSHARRTSKLNPFSGSTSSLSSGSAKSRKSPSSAQGLGLIGMLHDQKEEKTPTKMLNGRVYGAKRNQQNANQKNPFANVNTNPEFVEWGYGGMGSVKSSNVGGSVWGKVQSSAGQDDPDDGGGMEWVRKRREQREKEKLEREKKQHEETVKEEEAPAPMDDSPTISTPNVDSGAATPTADHVMSAVNIPAHPHAPKHHHTGSQVSIHTVTEMNLYEEMQKKKALQEEESKNDEDEDEDEQKDDDEEQREEDDEEEDDEEERMRCMQSIGAGVEKISRHKS